MTPLDRLRIEKAATDCGFEMTPTDLDGGLELRSACFPESVTVRSVGALVFQVTASNSLMLDFQQVSGAVAAKGYEALYSVLQTAAAHARTLPNRVAEAFHRQCAGLPRSTEAERLVVLRVGQNLFRSALLDYWQRKCCVTDLDEPGLLRASHIKPWAECVSDEERLDVFNGLLLAPHLDALFDAGWVTFDRQGQLLVAPSLSVKARHCLGVTEGMSIRQLRGAHQEFLEFHRRNIFRGPSQVDGVAIKL